MDSSVVLELTIAVLAGLILATLITPIKRSLPYWFETALWLGLIVACWLAVTGLSAGNPRNVMESALWGAQAIVTTSFGLVLGGLAGWIADQRFAIANAVLLLIGADILILALLFSRRNSRGWQPQVRLKDWFEYPAQLKPARAAAAVVESPFEGINRRGAVAAGAFGAASAMWLTNFLIWTRDVFMPNVATRQAVALAAGRAHALELESKARDWRAAHAPAIGEFAKKTVSVVDLQTHRLAARPHNEEDEHAHDSDRLAS